VSRLLTAHQPNYLPWLGLFHKVGQADVWVVADDVQFTKHGLINRNRIRTAAGWQWLTVPVRTRGRSLQSIREVEIAEDPSWRRKHWQTLQCNYHRTPHFAEHADFLESVYAREWPYLIDLNLELCTYLLRQFGIELEIRRSSTLALSPDRNQRLVDMVHACNCDAYLAGGGGSKNYLDEDLFRRAGIDGRFDSFAHPIYSQAFPGFEPSMTALDLLFNCGPASREILFHG
jgi:hypothetical protein